MVAKELIDNNIPVLKQTDNVDRALQLINESKTVHLPYLENEEFKGFFSEDQLHIFDYDAMLSDISPLVVLNYIDENLPLFELIKVFSKTQLDILPVFDEQKTFLGIVEKKEINEQFIAKFSLDDNGGLIEINLHNKEYSLSEISKIIEYEYAKITSLFLFHDSANHLHLTLKLDIAQISGVINSLERYGYDVVSYYASEPVSNLEKDRYDLLMKYLSI
ncbi:CBS domain-containing protein [Lacihabitans sp. LS3-19]|uniref:CBS domain-containing protein n=1 Tax=Lacihabitans sp. LS3-19 TaxID=2487335 RepID=UPI0020CFABA0|nr:CBS domain-containing protein [Lacihabitans sp. LS3-19]MCP9769150.1 CBS domain-containing protein [Lacihabitans sp. LS3-19]